MNLSCIPFHHTSIFGEKDRTRTCTHCCDPKSQFEAVCHSSTFSLADDVGVEPTQAINQTLLSKEAHYRSVNHPFLVPRERFELSHPKILDSKSRVSTIPPPRHIYFWYLRWDSNPQSQRHWILSPTCIPDSTTQASFWRIVRDSNPEEFYLAPLAGECNTIMRTIHSLADDVGVEPTQAINQTLFSKQAHYRSVNHPYSFWYLWWDLNPQSHKSHGI